MKKKYKKKKKRKKLDRPMLPDLTAHRTLFWFYSADLETSLRPLMTTVFKG